jgi:hypothetical protein
MKATNKKSGKCNTPIDANNALYEFCKSHGPKSIQAKLDCWEHSLLTHHDHLAPLSGHDEDPDIIIDKSSNQKLTMKRATNQCITKSITMSSNS